MAQHLRVAVSVTGNLVSEVGTAITAVTFQVGPETTVLLLGRNGEDSIPDADWNNALAFSPGSGRTNVSIADLFPGIAGANRLYGRAVNRAGTIVVSHG